jgi:uncharacterized protein YybS (DUF2232 family)
MVRAAALSGAFFLAGGAIPLIGTILLMLAPAPIIVYAVGRPNPNLRATIAVLLATAFVAILWGPFGGLAYFVSFGLATALICYMLERRSSFEMITAVAAAVMVTASVVAALVIVGGPDALLKAIHDGLTQMMARGEDFYKLLGLQTTIPPDAQASVISFTMHLLPALALLTAATSILLNLRVFWRWAGPQRLTYNLFGDLSRWSAPEWMVWLLLAGGFGLFIPVPAVSDIALNGFVCIAFVYLCQGLAIIGFYFQSLSVPSIVRGIIYFVVFAQPVVAALVSVAGVFDMWIDFRRLKPPSPEANNLGDFF